MQDVEGVRGWEWQIGNCQCGAVGVPVASNDYYTSCAPCLHKVAEALEKIGATLKDYNATAAKL